MTTRRTADQTSATCRVFTFKEGLLSAMAHDLEIEVGRFTVAWDEDTERAPGAGPAIDATFEATSLRVLHPMAHGRPNPSALSARDHRKIEETIADEVLQVRRHPTIRFVCDRVDGEPGASERTLRGRLTLRGREGPIAVRVRREGARYVAEATIHQPDFGMTPYSAMLGTLRIQPDVRVRVEVPA